jgi:diphthamide synthase (EF-2-diphthine--ammonia ligase)
MDLINRLKRVAASRRINPAGEGGESESLNLNASFYSRPVTDPGVKIQSRHDRYEQVPGGFS